MSGKFIYKLWGWIFKIKCLTIFFILDKAATQLQTEVSHTF